MIWKKGPIYTLSACLFTLVFTSVVCWSAPANSKLGLYAHRGRLNGYRLRNPVLNVRFGNSVDGTAAFLSVIWKKPPIYTLVCMSGMAIHQINVKVKSSVDSGGWSVCVGKLQVSSLHCLPFRAVGWSTSWLFQYWPISICDTSAISSLIIASVMDWEEPTAMNISLYAHTGSLKVYLRRILVLHVDFRFSVEGASNLMMRYYR